MRRFLKTLGLTFILLAILDLAAVGVLHVLKTQKMLGSLTHFFEYGRSVPGKHAIWMEALGQPNNPMEAGWVDQLLEAPNLRAPPVGTEPSLTIRSYGMSFSANILHAAVDRDPSLAWDLHTAPTAPPNSVYHVALADREFREQGDVVVLAFLSSALVGMPSFSNRTWNFEQPIPFTYPIYRAVEDELSVKYPIVSSLNEEQDPALNRLWADQLAEHDANYSNYAFAWPLLDYSPFFRLVRRAFASLAQTQSKQVFEKEGEFPIQETLHLIIRDFSQMVREDNQRPIVFLIQSRNPHDLNLIQMTRAALEEYNVSYVATEEHFSPNDIKGFMADGHYQKSVDDVFAQAFLELLVDWRANP